MPNESFLILGVAGAIGAGKSAVASILKRHGFDVIDSDARAKAQLQSPEVKETLRRWWGERIFNEAGEVDRHVVASIVFANPEARRQLEDLIHPRLDAARTDTIESARASGRPGVVIDAPLLFEAGLDRLCDAVIFVDASKETCLRRVMDRGWDDGELQRRQRAQMGLDVKRERSTHVVHNSGDLEALEAALLDLLPRIGMDS